MFWMEQGNKKYFQRLIPQKFFFNRWKMESNGDYKGHCSVAVALQFLFRLYETRNKMKNISFSVDSNLSSIVFDETELTPINRNFTASTLNVTVFVINIVCIVASNITCLLWVKLKVVLFRRSQSIKAEYCRKTSLLTQCCSSTALLTFHW